MSKSDADPRSRIVLTDVRDVIHEKIKKAFTDFRPDISYEPDVRPGVSNLVAIHSSVTSQSIKEVCDQAKGLNTVQYKEVVSEAVNSKLAPIRSEIERLTNDSGYVHTVLDLGANKARAIANETYTQVLNLVGFR